MAEHNFERTTCSCNNCKACCKRQPGPLAPNDFERIAEFLGETLEEAKEHFWASPGCIVRDGQGVTRRIGSITPKWDRRTKACVFLSEEGKCKIHSVAPFGCAYFDTHMDQFFAHARSCWLATVQSQETYQALRATLSYATHHKPAKYDL